MHMVFKGSHTPRRTCVHWRKNAHHVEGQKKGHHAQEQPLRRAPAVVSNDRGQRKEACVSVSALYGEMQRLAEEVQERHDAWLYRALSSCMRGFRSGVVYSVYTPANNRREGRVNVRDRVPFARERRPNGTKTPGLGRIYLGECGLGLILSETFHKLNMWWGWRRDERCRAHSSV